MTVSPTGTAVGGIHRKRIHVHVQQHGQHSVQYVGGSEVVLTIPAGWTQPSVEQLRARATSRSRTAGGSNCGADTTPSISSRLDRAVDDHDHAALQSEQHRSPLRTASAGRTPRTSLLRPQQVRTRSRRDRETETAASPTSRAVEPAGGHREPGAASQLVFTTQPGGATAGSTWTNEPVVKVEDSFDNVITTQNTGSITMSIAAGGPQASVHVGHDNRERHGRRCHLHQPRRQHRRELHAHRDAQRSIAGVAAKNSSAFTVSPAAENKLAITSQPAGVDHRGHLGERRRHDPGPVRQHDHDREHGLDRLAHRIAHHGQLRAPAAPPGAARRTALRQLHRTSRSTRRARTRSASPTRSHGTVSARGHEPRSPSWRRRRPSS